MNTEITLTVKLKGALQQYNKESKICVKVPNNSNLSTLKEAIIRALQKEAPTLTCDTALIESSVFANETEILERSSTLKTDQTLILLPPVCGG